MKEEIDYLGIWPIETYLTDDFVFSMAILEKARQSCLEATMVPADRISQNCK